MPGCRRALLQAVGFLTSRRSAVAPGPGLEAWTLVSLSTARRWLTGVLVTALALLVSGVPTGLVPSSFYVRMTPVTWWDYPIWVVAAVLTGLLAASFVRGPDAPASGAVTLGTCGVLSVLAIGCPICNKLVVAALGVSGALDVWAPLQPFLGLLSVALLATALRARVRGVTSCPVQSVVPTSSGL